MSRRLIWDLAFLTSSYQQVSTGLAFVLSKVFIFMIGDILADSKGEPMQTWLHVRWAQMYMYNDIDRVTPQPSGSLCSVMCSLLSGTC